MVLGATGRIGSILRRHWRAAGVDGAVRWSARAPRAGIRACDPLRDPDSLLRAAEGASAILCLAGVTPQAAAAGADWDDNTRLAQAALAAGTAVGARVYLASSAAIYGRAGGVLDETRAPSPVAPYGVAKADMEARALGQGGAVTILRIGNVAGADAALGGWRPGFQLDVFPDGATPRRSYIGPRALARALAGLLTADHVGDLAADHLGDRAGDRVGDRAADRAPEILNIAQPGPVGMGALLDAAGFAWTPRPAPADAIATVELATARLAGRVDLAPASAAGLVAEWRQDRDAGGAAE